MSTNNTEHLELHKWEPFDAFTREEFNENFEKLDGAVEKNSEGLAAALSELRAADAADKAELKAADAALTKADADILANLGTVGTNLRFETGSYTGTGKYGKDNARTLNFKLRPLLVFVGIDSNYASHPMSMLNPSGCSSFVGATYYTSVATVTWGERSVTWYATTSETDHANILNRKYYYAVLGY